MRRVSRELCLGGIALAVMSGLAAQTPAPAPAAPSAPAAPTPSPTTPTTPSTPRPPGIGGGNTGSTGNQPQMPPRPIQVSGRVIMSDGSELPERVTIERLCSVNNVRPEGFTDSKGYFNLQIGVNQMGFQDASSVGTFDPNSQSSSAASITNSATLGGGNQFWDCELRARLPGYRSTSVLLAGRRPMDPSDIGSIVLTAMNKVEGSAVSFTSSQAPKDARKSLEKGLEAMQKKKMADAEKEFRKAVGIYPKYAEAWMELGKMLRERKQFPEAREALEKSVAADPRYIYPHEQLYLMAFDENNWQELADTTDRLLRLNPYDFIVAFYYNGVANYQLGHLPDAEKSLRETLAMDFRNQMPKAHYVLGLVLASQKNFAEAKDSLETFLKLAPDDEAVARVNNFIYQLEQELRAEVRAPQR